MRHEATVVWTLDGDDMPAGRYSRAHEIRFDGGAVVAGSPAPEIVPAPWSRPENVDPEEMFTAAVAACHMLWFLDLARRRGLTAERYVDRAVGVMTRNDAGELWVSRVTLRPRIGWREDPGEAATAELHEAAHRRCFIANSVKTEIVVEAADQEGRRHDR